MSCRASARWQPVGLRSESFRSAKWWKKWSPTATTRPLRLSSASAAKAPAWRRGSASGKSQAFVLIAANANADSTETASNTTPPPDQWTDAEIVRLIATTAQATKYRATQRFLKDPRDTATPNGTVTLLARLFNGEALSKSSTNRLIEILKLTTSFPTRIKGLLPPGTVVAHKTGSTGTTGTLTAGTNDSGVIYLPGGRLLALSVYVKASTKNDEVRDAVIAQIARAAFDHFV